MCADGVNRNKSDIHSNKYKNCINIAHLNVNSLLPKVTEISYVLNKYFIDILCLNESKIDASISDEELKIENYSLVRKDRTRYVGGVAVYFRNCLSVNLRPDLMDLHTEIIWAEVKLSNFETFLLSATYRPNHDAQYRESLINNFEKAVNINPNILILGDFNENILNGVSGTLIEYLCALLNVDQLVNEPTRCTVSTRSLIDLILSSFKDRHLKTEVIKCCLSDHYMVRLLQIIIIQSNVAVLLILMR